MIKTRLDKLRIEMSQNGFAGYLVPSNDEYLSEYTPSYARRLEYITEFTGSNGLAIILEKTVLFFTDGRYITQCFSELDDHLFEVYDQVIIPEFNWTEFIDKDSVIAYDPKLLKKSDLKNFDKLNLKPHNINLIDIIWADQPPKPNSKIYEYTIEYAGQSFEDKIEKCRKLLEEQEAEALLITDSASVCWLLNIRASDVEFSPLLLANAIVKKDSFYLFTDQNRFDDNLTRNDIEILPETEFEEVISKLNGTIIFDENQSSSYVSSILQDRKHKHLANPCMLWKACKNNIEIQWMQRMHLEDAVAVCELLSFIAEAENLHDLTEYDIGIKLGEYRRIRQNYVYDSFPTICGFQENAAIIHYRANQFNAKKITGDGLLLIDSGGQYLGATTDITRTISIGTAEEKYSEFYTRVLKGHIALVQAKFPKQKLSGSNLDILARQYLWEIGADYAHGTGHGVGSFLSVHEGPQNISLISSASKIHSGMVISNEPGYYVPGEFGIRIENLMYAKESRDIQNFLEFDMLTLVPYEKKLINIEMLEKHELLYLKSYYKKIELYVKPLLSKEAKQWLNSQIENFI